MKTNYTLSMLTAALLMPITASFSLAQAPRATPQVPVSPEVVRACAAVERTEGAAPGCAMALGRLLEANNADLMAVLMAARSTKLILQKYGLTMEQLDEAVIVLRDETGGAANATRVTVEITCCPLTITITIRL